MDYYDEYFMHALFKILPEHIYCKKATHNSNGSWDLKCEDAFKKGEEYVEYVKADTLPKWISVKELFPPRNHNVLVITDNGHMGVAWRAMYSYNELSWSSYDSWIEYNASRIVAWCELPKYEL